MITSMTGFGKAEAGNKLGQWFVDIRSWNHRFFECTARMPETAANLEEKICGLVKGKTKRGKVMVSISLKPRHHSDGGLFLDEAKLRLYVETLRKIQKQYGLAEEPITLQTLLSIPNLFTAGEKEIRQDECWDSLKPVIEEAIAQFLKSKTKEGRALARDMRRRVFLIRSSLKRIEGTAKALPARYKSRLAGRLRELTSGARIDSMRLEQEVALLAERIDITEELVRARHHVGHLIESLSSGGEAGKKIDFIAQELYREINTMASKSQSAPVSEEVIRIKSELDKIREQAQNIE